MLWYLFHCKWNTSEIDRSFIVRPSFVDLSIVNFLHFRFLCNRWTYFDETRQESAIKGAYAVRYSGAPFGPCFQDVTTMVYLGKVYDQIMKNLSVSTNTQVLCRLCRHDADGRSYKRTLVAGEVIVVGLFLRICVAFNNLSVMHIATCKQEIPNLWNSSDEEGIEPRAPCSVSLELNHSTTAAHCRQSPCIAKTVYSDLGDNTFVIEWFAGINCIILWSQI